MDKIAYMDDQIKILKRYDSQGNFVKASICFLDDTGSTLFGVKSMITYDRSGNIIKED